ncbi:MAG: hypothetical protein KDB14_11680 [Planctomycetales bacterium]|nr:hypothetical protein [Planctomycetales bacterium]
MSAPSREKKLVATIVALVFFGSTLLWLWTSGVYYRPLPKPGCAIRFPFVSLEAGANEQGVHFVAMRQSGRQFPTIRFETRFSGVAGYHHSHVVNFLGLMIAVLPTAYDGGDYSVSPHAALVLPFWLLIVGAGYLFSVLTPIATWLWPYCRLSRRSCAAGGFVLALFAALNVVPSAERPGAAIRPRTISKWVELTLQPSLAYPEVMLTYGFPFTCRHKGFINTKPVDLFYGASTGWKPHKAMENVCVAALTAFALVLAIEFLRRDESRRQAAPPNKAVNPTVGSGG